MIVGFHTALILSYVLRSVSDTTRIPSSWNETECLHAYHVPCPFGISRAPIDLCGFGGAGKAGGRALLRETQILDAGSLTFSHVHVIMWMMHFDTRKN